MYMRLEMLLQRHVPHFSYMNYARIHACVLYTHRHRHTQTHRHTHLAHQSQRHAPIHLAQRLCSMYHLSVYAVQRPLHSVIHF